MPPSAALHRFQFALINKFATCVCPTNKLPAKCRHANDVNHVAFSTVCGFGELVRQFICQAEVPHCCERGARNIGAVWDILFFDPYHQASHDVRRRATDYCRYQREALLFGAHEFVADFPDQLQEPCAYLGAKLHRCSQVRSCRAGPHNRWSSLPLPW
jgi:hypothetical protein